MLRESNGSGGKDRKNTDRRLPGQNSLMIRMLVGAYLLYTSYSLLDSFINGGDMNKYMLGAFIAAFAVIGILLVLFAGRDLYRGKYTGGKMDPEMQDEAEDEKDDEQEQK